VRDTLRPSLHVALAERKMAALPNPVASSSERTGDGSYADLRYK
jgi:hypothetical protein